MNPASVATVVLLAVWMLSATAHWFLPRLTRPDLYFAVTVAAGFRNGAEGRSILRRYRRGLLGASILTLGLLLALVLTSALLLAPLALLLQLGAYFSVFYRTRRLVLPHSVAPTTVREARLVVCFGEAGGRSHGGPLLEAGRP